jgi:hypothetical protein
VSPVFLLRGPFEIIHIIIQVIMILMDYKLMLRRRFF